MLEEDAISSANRPRVLQLPDKTVHYVWRVDTGAQKTNAAGIYYYSETQGKTIKVSSSLQFAAVACGNRLVLCTSDEAAPNKILFRVIHNSTVHPPTEITIGKGREHQLWLEYMAVAGNTDRIWFMVLRVFEWVAFGLFGV